MSKISRFSNKDDFKLNYLNTVNLVFIEGDDSILLNSQHNDDTILNEVYIPVTTPNEGDSPVTILNEGGKRWMFPLMNEIREKMKEHKDYSFLP